MQYKIEQDDCYESPREWNNLGTMVCWHRSYNLGDEQLLGNARQIQKQIDNILSNDCFVLPLYLYDHSGITMSTSPFSCPWDSGRVGFIYVTKASVRSEWGKQRISPKLHEQVFNVLRQEVETYDQYLTGDVWGYTIADRHGDIIDSCWGFYGYDYCKQEAKSQMAYFQKQETAELIDLQSAIR